MKKIISQSFRMKNGSLDDDYTLYDEGTILHEYDRNIYPGGFNLSETLSANDVGIDVKERLLTSATDEHKELVKQLLGMP